MSNELITVVMPALNEEANVGLAITNTLSAFDYYGINGELVVVDDGSTDKTSVIIRSHLESDSRVKTTRHETSQGIGKSFWDAVELAEGQLITMLPGDNENDPVETLRYYRLLDHVDMVIPFVFNKEVRSIYRNILSYFYRTAINTTFLVNLNYTNGTVLYRKSVLDGLNEKSVGFFFQTDIIIRSLKKGYLFAEVPYKLSTRQTGKSKAITFPSLWQVARGYMKLVRDLYIRRGGDRLTQHYASDSVSANRRKVDGK